MVLILKNIAQRRYDGTVVDIHKCDTNIERIVSKHCQTEKIALQRSKPLLNRHMLVCV